MRNLFVAAGLAIGATAHAADITVLATPGIKEAYVELAPQFEKANQHKITTTWAGTADVMKRMKAGEVFDAVILASDSLEELIDTSKVMAGSRSDVARSLVGVAVKAGAPKPDISTADAVKKALAAAKSVVISSGPSGVYLNALFGKLGVMAELKPKLKVTPPGVAVGGVLAKGEGDLGFQQVSELVNYPGIQYVGPLPAEIQKVTIFSGGVAAASREPDVARAFLQFLAAPEHQALLKKHGLDLGQPSPY
ncbi:MAG TPA: substrate-binding domain-containing protein [Burkholderiales bacterium]|nr:substrate-binding domain-containing protein [Burkholderiales bacterium]